MVIISPLRPQVGGEDEGGKRRLALCEEVGTEHPPAEAKRKLILRVTKPD